MSTQEKELDNKMFTAEERLDTMEILLDEVNTERALLEDNIPDIDKTEQNKKDIARLDLKAEEIEQRIDLLEQIRSLEIEIERLEQNIQYEITMDS